jgi:hypothetical protein
MVSPRDFGAIDFPYAALKYSASDLCCALKPLALRWLMATSSIRSLVYLDSDICLRAARSAAESGGTAPRSGRAALAGTAAESGALLGPRSATWRMRAF